MIIKYYYISLWVPEPFSQYKYFSDICKDYCYYCLLKRWLKYDNNKYFNDVHEGNYNVRELAPWNDVIKPRIHSRLDRADIFVLILSSNTRESWAINEEIEYGVNILRLPVIVIYPDFDSLNQLYDESTGNYSNYIINLWNKLPKIKNIIESKTVTVKHFPLNKNVLNAYFGVK